MHKFTALVFALLFLILGLSVAQAWLWRDRLTQTNRNRADNAKVWHAVVCQIEVASLARMKDPARRKMVVTFYDGLLTQDVQTSGCGLTP